MEHYGADLAYSIDDMDEILPEPLGSAHRDPEAAFQTVQNALTAHLRDLEMLDTTCD